MKRHLIGTAAALVCLLAGSVGSASAQQGGYYGAGLPHYTNPYQNFGGLSPYLNLLRGGDAAANYYLGVIPETQRRSDYDQLRTAIQEAELRSGTPENYDISKPLDRTGHATAFGYYSSYYPIAPNRLGVPPNATLGRR